MKYIKVLALRGPNYWAKFPVLEAWVDLGDLNETSSDSVPGFNERLMAWLPTMIEHRCSIGERGGFFERLRRGTYPAHILEHVALELQSLAGTPVGFGRARETSTEGIYRVAVRYKEERLGRACLETARELVLAALYNRPFDVQVEVEKLRNLKHEVCLGPSTGAIADAAAARGIPVSRLNGESLVQLGSGAKQRRILTAETDRTGAIAEWIAQDKELTRSLLRSTGVPVPYGRTVSDAEDAWAAAQEIGAAVVVKPQYGNQGRGVTTNLTTREQVTAAYNAAVAEGKWVIVEQYAPGDDHRLLVIGDRMVAASRREAAHVIGDGSSSIAQLVEITNRDPRRSEGHATALSKIQLDTISLTVLAEQGFTAESVPAAGQRVLIRRNANLSTGGTATDVTDMVHPEVAARAVEAAKVVGLDIAGVDVVAVDISRPLEEQQGVVVEVNAGPGLRMHLDPSCGTPRPVGEAIVDMLFPAGESGRIPVVGVTGTNGKTTTTCLVSHMLKLSGKRVGMTCTEGIFVGGRRIDSGDCAGPKSARNVLMNPLVEAAVLETARGGILREGLGYDQCDIGIVTNIGDGDHLGIAEVFTAEQLAYVKRTVIDAVSKTGYAVLNAEDRLVAEMAEHSAGGVIFFSQDPTHPVIVKHRAEGGRAVLVRGGFIVLAEGEHEVELIELEHVPLTVGGRIRFQIENAIAATAAAWGLGLTHDTIVRALETFTSSYDQVPARFNVLRGRGITVILDYVHNTSALTALIDGISRLPHRRRTIMYTAAGDRRNEDIQQQAEIIGDSFDQVILYEGAYVRGRTPGEITALFQQGLAGRSRVSTVLDIRDQMTAARRALETAEPGDLVIIVPDLMDEIVQLSQQVLTSTEGEGSMTEEIGESFRVATGPLGKSVYAARVIDKGEVIMTGWGDVVTERTRHSLQVDHGKHVITDTAIQFINHSCEPNCGLVIRRDSNVMEIHALRQIEAGEELFTDYATFEFEIQFMTDGCRCGSQRCRGLITGYKDLPQNLRDTYGQYVADYLQEMDAAMAK